VVEVPLVATIGTLNFYGPTEVGMRAITRSASFLGLVYTTRPQENLRPLCDEVPLHVCESTKAHRKRERRKHEARKANKRPRGRATQKNKPWLGPDAVATSGQSQFVGFTKPR